MADWPKLENSDGYEDDTVLNNYSVAVTGGGGANSKGSWVTVFAALARPISGLLITGQDQPNQYQIMDIGIGSAGNEIAVFPNMNISNSLSGTHGDFSIWVPLAVRAGERISMRSQGSGGSGFVTVKAIALTDAFAGVQSPQRWVDWGTDLSGSRGTQLTAAGGSNVKAAWTQIVASTPFTTRWLMIAFQGVRSPVDYAIDIGVGASSAEVVLFPNLHYTIECLGQNVGPFPYTIPAGTRLSARHQDNGGGNPGPCVQIFGGM